MGLQICFRADAALWIGTGHVMRCLTLADALSAAGHDCHFICRSHRGHLLDVIHARGYTTSALPAALQQADPVAGSHAHWLGVSAEQDAADTAAVLQSKGCDWLVVDHYALDAQWEAHVRGCSGHVLVIDDLADRAHDCDLLLDQTYSRRSEDYLSLVPASARLLCGSANALLRPDFAAQRDASLTRRAVQPYPLQRVLVSMGGVDADNATAEVLRGLAATPGAGSLVVTVVMGGQAPWLGEVQQLSQSLALDVTVLVDVSDMASLMAQADLAIGAAGATAWERCCLGLPTLMAVLADNQRLVAEGLSAAGAVQLLPAVNSLAASLPGLLEGLLADPEQLRRMSRRAAALVDGGGARRVVETMEMMS